jgi:Tol biopolymer transport system component
MRTCLIVIVLGAAIATSSWRPALAGPALLAAQSPWSAGRPLPTPALFAEGSITTPDDEMDAGFAPDGRTIYFTKDHMGQRLGLIVVSRFERGHWTEPEVASFSGRYTDYDPFVTRDGSKLFFASNRPATGTARKDFDIWMVERSGDRWGEPKNLGAPINTPQDEFYPTVAADGALYFSATRPDTKGRSDIYRARWRDGRYDPPENLGDAVNSPATEVDSYVAPDQSYVIFAGIGRPDDLGGGDLYVSQQVNGAWTPARHIGAGVNSSSREYCPSASPDGQYFFFTSFRGFGDSVPDRPWTFADFRRGTASILNGFGNIYQIDMAAVLGR